METEWWQRLLLGVNAVAMWEIAKAVYKVLFYRRMHKIVQGVDVIVKVRKWSRSEMIAKEWGFVEE